MSSATLPQLFKFAGGIPPLPSSTVSLVKNSPCLPCQEGRQTRRPHHSVEKPQSSRPLQLIHTDLVYCDIPTLKGCKYFITFTDDYTRYVHLYLLNRKSDAITAFQTYKAEVETALSPLRIQSIRSDRGGEYLNYSFSKLLSDAGIQHKPTPAYSPQSNGVSERLNRTLLERTRAMLHQQQLPKTMWGLWGEAIQTAVYLHNRTKITAQGMTSYELWNGRKPNLEHIRTWGCFCTYYNEKVSKGKLEPRALPGMLLGYSSSSSIYRVMPLPFNKDNKVIITRDLTFFEDTPLGKQLQHQPESAPSLHDLLQDLPEEPKYREQQPTKATAPPEQEPGNQQEQPITLSDSEEQGRDAPQQNSTPATPRSSENEGTAESPFSRPVHRERHLQELLDQPAPTQRLRRSTRERRAPIRWPAYYASAALTTEEDTELADVETVEPTTYAEAINGADADLWQQAMKKEMQALHENKTWTLVPRPANCNLVGAKWVYRIKRRQDGSVDKYKARLVAKGHTQKEGIDYTETFSPVIRFTTIRLVLTLAAIHDWELQQLDVQTAFLNGLLHETIYMQQAPGFEDPDNPGYVCKLQRSLYGLKQAPKAWNERLHSALTSLGLRRSEVDHALYVRERGTSLLLLLVYVDDLVLTGNDTQGIAEITEGLQKHFKMTVLGELSDFLGMKVVRDRSRRTIYLSQPKNIQAVLTKFGFAGKVKAAATPISSEAVRVLAEDQPEKTQEEPADAQRYQSAVGSLMYLMVTTRPDLAYALGIVSQYLQTPREKHWASVKRIFRYLSGTRDLSLSLGQSEEKTKPTLTGYSDADWGTCPASRKSISGYTVFLNGSPLSWASKKQTCVALSSTEAEYVAAGLLTKELLWIKMLAMDLKIPLQNTTAYIDNIGGLLLAKNNVHHPKTKHISLVHHFIRDHVNNGEIELKWVPTQNQVADIFTKALDRTKFETFRKALSLTTVRIT
jgi:transposase InsO family protein